MTDLLIPLIKIKDRYLLMTRAASATTLPGGKLSGRRRSRDKDWPRAVGRAARCGSLTLLVAGEPTIACASIVVALQAIPILASSDRGYATCENGRRRRESKKKGTHFLSHVEVPP